MLVCEVHKEEIRTVNPNTFEEKRYFREDPDYPDCPIESLRTYNRKPFRLEEHLQRLLHSAKAIGKPLPEGILRFIREWVFKIIKEASFDPQFLRITATSNRVLIVSRELEIDSKIYEGVKVMATDLIREPPLDAKTASRNVLEKAYQLALARNFFECLLVNRKEEITEGTRFNVLWIRNGTLYWCPFALDGITQQTVLELASETSIPIPTQRMYQGGLPISALRYIDELFLTNSRYGIIPVTLVNGKEIGNGDVGPVTLALMHAFNHLTGEEA